jgi:hypothetical protein
VLCQPFACTRDIQSRNRSHLYRTAIRPQFCEVGLTASSFGEQRVQFEANSLAALSCTLATVSYICNENRKADNDLTGQFFCGHELIHPGIYWFDFRVEHWLTSFFGQLLLESKVLVCAVV